MLLKELTDINGVSGSEDNVRNFIREKAKQYATEIIIDSIGNLIVYKKGTTSNLKVMLSAHMDEVGFMVTGFTEEGMLRFKPIGGIDDRILLGKRVLVGEKKIPGVIGEKPIHMQDKNERETITKIKKMYIDIGAMNKDEAEKKAPLGDYIAFSSNYLELGENLIKAKALDDRAGCAILLELLEDDYDFDLYACFTVQEEVGLRGAQVSTYRIKPDIAIVVESTTCSDVPGVEESDYSTILGNGPALTIMDRTSYVDKEVVNFLYETAKNNNIPVQYKQTTTGGNDAGKIQLSGIGVKVAAISVPARYIHSPVSIINKNDFLNLINILKLSLKDIKQLF